MPNLSGLRVCFIAGTLGQGGAERQLVYIVGALRTSGALPHVLSLTRGEYYEDRIRGMGVPVTWVGRSSSRIARCFDIAAHVRRIRPSILQSQHFHTNLYTAATARMLGLHGIGAIRSDCVSEVAACGLLFGRLSLLAPRMVAANSQGAIRNAVALGRLVESLHFLPNVVDTERFVLAKQRGNQCIRLLIVGRLVPAKRVDRFLTVLTRVRQHHPEVTAAIVGDGALRPHLEQQAAALGLLPHAVAFRGAIAEMPSVYETADVLVLTSDWEGTPNVLLEAMASGVPVVATGVGGVPDLVRHGKTGLVSDPSDEDSLTENLLRLIADEPLRANMGAEARRYIEKHHALDRLPGFLEDLYRAVLQ